MRDKKFLTIAMGIFVVGIFFFSIIYTGFDFKLTGYAVFGNDEQAEFDLGTYNNVEWNGSAVILSSNQVSGTYTSQIFDATNDATWNNLSWEGETIVTSNSFLTSAIHLGLNATEVFALDDIYYLADMKDSSKNVYLNFSDSLINNSVLKIYAKKEKGITIGIYSQSDSSGTNPLGTFSVESVVGEWYNVPLNIATSTNSIWIGEGVGSGADPKDYFDYIYAEIPGTNLSFQIKNCSLSDCSDGTWQDADLTSLNLQSRYFQYKVDFITPDSSISPSLTSVNIDYDLINTAPSITLTSPYGGASYGTNESLVLDFSVFDADDNIDSCWYNIGGEDIAIPGCANTTFDIAEGANTLNIYVNDTVGLEASDSANFNVAVGAPSVVLDSPIEVYLSSGQNIEFSYTPTDIDLASCWLLGNFNGVFQTNQTDDSPTSGNINSFFLNLNDGEYLWNIGCNDSEGNSATNGNTTFYVDTINPTISLTEPTGTKTSRTGISLIFDVSDNSPLTCYYNITTSVGTNVVNNVEIKDCNNIGFDVSSDGDYILYLWAVDSAGNSNFLDSSFSVDNSTPAPAPAPVDNGGSSGGSGGSIIISRTSAIAELKIDEVNIIASVGEDKNLLVNVKNVGGVSANKCSLIAGEGYEKYIDSNDLFNIGVGEIVEFMFVLTALDEDVRELDLSIKCLENVSAEVPIEIIVWKPDLDVSIVEISFDSDNGLLIAYNIEPTDSSTRSLFFKILNSDGEIVAETSEDVELIFGQLYRGEILIDISNVAEDMLKIVITDENKVSFIEESFVYGRSPGIIGFSMVNMDGDFSYIWIVLFVFLILAVLLAVRIWKLMKS
ncbi:MAG: hypothetical protein ABIF18_02500 [archaeon]